MVFFQLFSRNPEIIQVPAGRALFSEGDAGGVMYVLLSGEADVIVQNRVVEKLNPGSIVGEMGIVSPGLRSATVMADVDCEFVVIDERRFHFLVQEMPCFATQVMRVMVDRLQGGMEVARSCGLNSPHQSCCGTG